MRKINRIEMEAARRRCAGTQVKVCGITNEADAVACVEAGAQFLGFNFYARSPRYIAPLTARRVIEGLKPRGVSVKYVGVFVDEEAETVRRVAREANLDAVQLHGSESPPYCQSLKPLSVIKALRVSRTYSPCDAAEYETESLLLDGWLENARGGTGQTFDWRLAQRTRERVARFWLAGGLTAENVGEAVKVVRPFAVDVCSSVELAPGRKDTALVRRFVAAVNEADAAPGVGK